MASLNDVIFLTPHQFQTLQLARRGSRYGKDVGRDEGQQLLLRVNEREVHCGTKLKDKHIAVVEKHVLQAKFNLDSLFFGKRWPNVMRLGDGGTIRLQGELRLAEIDVHVRKDLKVQSPEKNHKHSKKSTLQKFNFFKFLINTPLPPLATSR
uniref:FHA_2 domain-containing protein n=1 Tax=Panagrellus redivivus TaxID=6233 RepID=A0A7E4V8F6_PANRE